MMIASALTPSVSIADIYDAQQRIRPFVYHTPLLHSQSLASLHGATALYLKAEHLQRTGSYKCRGAFYKLLKLQQTDPTIAQVIAVSTGNHAQAVALASRTLGMQATIVMPTTVRATAPGKLAATQHYGAQVELWGNTFDEAAQWAESLHQQTGHPLIHAFDDETIIAGQGTIGLEVLHDLPEVDAIFVPIGGGGLISGVGIALKTLKPSVRLYGVQAKRMPAVKTSLDVGHLVTLNPATTLADAININHPAQRTVHYIQDLVDDILVVDEPEIEEAIRFLSSRCKQVVEGAGAVGVAAVLQHRQDLHQKQVVVLLSGGNIEPCMLARVLAQPTM